MKIVIGNDHSGVDLKKQILEHLIERGFETINVGSDEQSSCDYPIYGEKVALEVASGRADLGIAICGTGIGISLAANRVPGIRAAVCSEPYSAKLTREHNNANIIAFGARVVGVGLAKMIVDAFIDASFEGERHKLRVNIFDEITNRYYDLKE